MYSVVVFAAIVSGGQAADTFAHHGWHGCYGGCYAYSWSGYGCWGYSCRGWNGCNGCYGCCGAVTPWLIPAPTVTSAELKQWNDYLARLDYEDQRDLTDLWSRADLGARRKLLTLIPVAHEDKPLTAAEQKRWDDYVKTLAGDKKKQAEENWKKATPPEKRRMLEKIPPRE
jgi:hypothetical protein